MLSAKEEEYHFLMPATVKSIWIFNISYSVPLMATKSYSLLRLVLLIQKALKIADGSFRSCEN
jgi:hypothetical protein